nr:hypothetical protein [Natronomonas marina]
MTPRWPSSRGPSLPSVERLAEAVPSRRRLATVALLVNLQAVGVVLYYAFSSATLTAPRYVVYGLLWVNVGLLAVATADRPDDIGFRRRRRALAVAAAYFGLLAVFGGLVGTGLGADATGLRVAWLTPGWGPALVYGGHTVSFVLMPAYVVGYLALSYLLYVTVLDAAVSAVGGVLGLVSCVSCTWPVLATVGSALFGGAGVLATSVTEVPYDVSTVVFLLTVALLYWRPGFR